jgi:hypothetical protein
MVPPRKHTLSDHLTPAQQEVLFEVIQERVDEHEATMKFHEHGTLTVDTADVEGSVDEVVDHVAAIAQQEYMQQHLLEVKQLLEE